MTCDQALWKVMQARGEGNFSPFLHSKKKKSNGFQDKRPHNVSKTLCKFMEGGTRSYVVALGLTKGLWISPLNYSTTYVAVLNHVSACMLCSLWAFVAFNWKNKIVMRSAKVVYQVFAFLALSVFIQSAECHDGSHYVRSVNLSAPETFVVSIFDEFGSNNSMNSQQFSLLLRKLNIGSSSNEQASKNGKSKVRANLMSMFVF